MTDAILIEGDKRISEFVMPKGVFTQNLCILLRSPVQIEQLEPLLRDFEVCAKREAMGEWEFSGPSLTVWAENLGGQDSF
jgi:hypothetical protein